MANYSGIYKHYEGSDAECSGVQVPRELTWADDIGSSGAARYLDCSGNVRYLYPGPHDGVGESNTASNLGAGSGLYSTKVGVNLRFKSIAPGTNMSFDDDGSTLTINSTGGGGGESVWSGDLLATIGDTNTSGINYPIYNGHARIGSSESGSGVLIGHYAVVPEFTAVGDTPSGLHLISAKANSPTSYGTEVVGGNYLWLCGQVNSALTAYTGNVTIQSERHAVNMYAYDNIKIRTQSASPGTIDIEANGNLNMNGSNTFLRAIGGSSPLRISGFYGIHLDFQEIGVPTYDVYTDQWQSFSPTISGWDTTPTKSCYYKSVGKLVYVAVNIQGSGNADGTSVSLPKGVGSSVNQVNAGFTAGYSLTVGGGSINYTTGIGVVEPDAGIMYFDILASSGPSAYGSGQTKWLCGTFVYQRK